MKAAFVSTFNQLVPKKKKITANEKPFQLLGDSREPLPMHPGSVGKTDSEYIRNGMVSIFYFIQPHTGRILHSVKEMRTAVG